MDKPQPKAAAIIVAAGSGSRSGGDIPKQYRAVRGKPMLRHSVEAFRAHPAFGTILAVVAPGQNALAAAAPHLRAETVDRLKNFRNDYQHTYAIPGDPYADGYLTACNAIIALLEGGGE